MGAISGRLAELWIGSGAGATLTKQACEATTTNFTYTYHVVDAAKRYLDPNTTVLVYDSDSLQTSGYRLLGHVIKFDSAPAGAVTVSGKALTMAETTLVQNYSVNLESEVYEFTSLGDTSKQYVGSGITGWSGSFERFFEGDTWSDRVEANSTQFFLRCYITQPGSLCLGGWVTLTGWSQETPIDGLERETIEFQGVGCPAYSIDET